MSQKPKDEFNPAEWLGMTKKALSAFFLYARSTAARDGIDSNYKSVRDHMMLFQSLGLADDAKKLTPKGKELMQKLCRWTLEDHGL